MDRKQLVKSLQELAGQKPRKVEVKGIGTVYVRPLTVAEVEKQTADPENAKRENRFCRAAARVICDEAGNRILDPENEEDIKALAGIPWETMQKLIGEDDAGVDKAGK